MLKNLVRKISFLNLGLLVASVLLAFIMAEAITRIFFSHEFQPFRYAFVTKPLIQDQEKTFGFKENVRIREVAVYWTGKQLEVEYDNTYTTNNFGLVQKTPFDPQKPAVVLIGDSFTQGNGAVPWFYTLEQQWQNQNYQFINLGMMGTGVEQWQHMLQWFAESGKISHVFICFISQDWNRARWIPRETRAGDGFYLVSWSQRRRFNENYQKTIYYIPPDISQAELLRYAEAIKEKYVSVYQPKKSFLGNFRFYNILRYNYDKMNYMNSEAYFNNNKTAFEQIVSEYGRNNITCFHIPQKEEVAQGSYIPLGQKVKDMILSQKLNYIDGLALCGLTSDDYYKNDSHPNAAGYDKIYQCLAKYGLSRLN